MISRRDGFPMEPSFSDAAEKSVVDTEEGAAHLFTAPILMSSMSTLDGTLAGSGCGQASSWWSLCFPPLLRQSNSRRGSLLNSPH